MNTRTRLWAALGLTWALLMQAAAPATAGAAPASHNNSDLPVPYGYAGFLAAGANFLANPGGPPPGANDWDCTPTPDRPNPVVLVHGFTANMTVNWATMSPLLANEGYCVFALTYGVPDGTPFPLDQIGGRNAMEDSAEELGEFVDEVLAVTGADQVDIVGHSEGSLMPNYYVKFLGGADKVDNYVGLTPLWDGTNLAGLDNLNEFARRIGLGGLVDGIADEIAPASLQFLRSSEFLEKMSSDGGPAVEGVNYTMIMTKYDAVVVPYTSGMMDAPNATNVVLQDRCWQDFAGHGMVGFDRNAAQVVLNALEGDPDRRIRCHFVPLSP